MSESRTRMIEKNKSSPSPDLQNMTVVKRSGVIVPFRSERIFNALEASVRDTYKKEKKQPLSDELVQIIEQVTESVMEALTEKFKRGESLTVEGIQDIVEKKLMEAGHHAVAKAYIIYRDQHKHLRETKEAFPRVIRSDRQSIVRFNPIKIASVIERAFRRTLGIEGVTPPSIIETVNQLTSVTIANILNEDIDKPVSTERIQESIENGLMAAGYFKMAKYVILERSSKREYKPSAPASPIPEKVKNTFRLKEFVEEIFAFAARGRDIAVQELIEKTCSLTFEGIGEKETHTAAVMAVKEKIESEPIHAKVASRILLDSLYRETLSCSGNAPRLQSIHESYFIRYMQSAKTEDSRLDPKLSDFDLKTLSRALDLQRDLDFSYLGLQTLYDRYFIHKDQRRLETPQIFWMRVAMGLALNEGEKKNERAIEFYHILSNGYFLSSTPTLFNAGTKHAQLSSCYLSTVGDDLQSIFKVISNDAQLSKWAGGIGNDWTPIRATGSVIKGTNGSSQGVIPFLKIVNDTAVAVNQGGKRKGAACVYLETWHLDIEDFLELRKNTGDERRRTHDMNTANWIPDLFMKRVSKGEKWTLFSPSDVPDLHDLYGKAFEKRYIDYEKQAREGKIKLFKEIEATALWRKLLTMLFETGHPWITFKDPCNLRSPQDHVGVVHSSNLCTEITLNSSLEETAVCNIGSVNLARHISEKGLDKKRLRQTVRTAMRMLDNVIDINFYPIEEAERSNRKHRPVGLGIMGFQDALYVQGICYASYEAVEFSDVSMEMISYFAIEASSDLAKEKGTYSSYKGSKWDRGILPIDSQKILREERGEEYVDINTDTTMDWDSLREKIKKQGMRNSNTMAIAPTATIANIADVYPSIEPSYKHLFVKSNLSGEFTVINPYLIAELKKRNLWNKEILDEIKYYDGCIAEIEQIPEEVKRLFLTAFDIEPEWLIECAARRQKWIDMAQSLNLYLNEPSGKKMHNMYFLAWKKGLKTTYYLRTLGATQIEKSSTDVNKKGIQPRWMKSVSASSEIAVVRSDKPKACDLSEGCESCQ